MMQILSGHSLTVSNRFQPETMSLQLTERTSTATMTLDEYAPTLAVGDWVRSDSGPGSGIVWRVRTVDTQFEKNTRTVTLEHAIATLKDKILFGEIKPADISGGTTATAEQAVSFILARQSDWVIGTMARTATKPYTFNGDSLFSALEMVSSTLTECVWEYDFSSYPFTLNMMAIDNDAASEMRMDRNIRTLKKSIDRSRMYTRFYPIGKNDLHLDSEYVSENEDLYGVISKTETDQSKETADELYDWAMERLNRHSHPLVTVTISGEDLSEATGEPLDSFTIGKYCRIPLPEFNTSIMERVSKLNYADVIHDPETVTVTLANEVPDVATIYKQEVTEKVSRGSRTHAKNGKDDHAWMVDTDDHIGLIAEAVAGEGADHDWSRVASVMVDGQGVHQRVQYTENQLVQAWSAIEMTESQITLEVANAVSNIHSVINQTASNIMLEVGRKNSVYSSWDNPSQSQDTQEGDIWIKTNGIRTYGKAGEYTWETLGGYAWADFYGSEIYVLDENGNWVLAGGDQLQNISRTLIDQTDDRIALITDGMSGDYAEFIQELGRIHSRVTSVEDGLSSTIEQTASMIRTAVWTANSELYSEIMQTQSMIRSEVANVESNIRSTITQTASGIWTEVGRKSTVFTQWGSPSGTKQTGDIWIKDNNIRKWQDMEANTWNALSEYKWSDFYGSIHYVWENGAWKEMSSQQLENINHAVQEVTDERISNIVEDMAGNYSEFVQEKNEIRSTVRNLSADLGSSIRQTASEIRSDVWAAKSSLYSSITQTASSIRMEVANTKSSLMSSITQTASQIRSEVTATKSSLSSSITQNANRIALVVDANGIKPASIVTAINNGASSVVISANHVQLDGYVSATNFSTVLANLSSAHIQRLYVDANIYGPNGLSLYTLGLMGVSLSSSGNTYTLKQQTLNGTETTIGTFSRAVSSWTMGWSNGVLTATANPQSQSCTTSIYQGTPSWSGKTVTIPILAVNSANPNVEVNTGRSVTATYSGGGGSITGIGLISTQAGPSAVSGYTWSGSLSTSSGAMWLKIDLSSGDKVYYDVT